MNVVVIVLTAMLRLRVRRTGAVCGDLSRSTATGHGACSHHGGVRHWTIGIER